MRRFQDILREKIVQAISDNLAGSQLELVHNPEFNNTGYYALVHGVRMVLRVDYHFQSSQNCIEVRDAEKVEKSGGRHGNAIPYSYWGVFSDTESAKIEALLSVLQRERVKAYREARERLLSRK